MNQPLGDSVHKTHMKYQFKVDITNNILCECRHRSKVKYVHDPNRSTRSGMAFHNNRFSQYSITTAIPTTVREHQAHLVCEKDIANISKIKHNLELSWHDHINSLDS